MIERASLAADLERARTDFHHLLALVGDDEWGKPTSGTRWTNEQLLFHMVFAYMIVQRLLILTWLFSHLPKWTSRGFAWVLNAATPLFDPVNYYVQIHAVSGPHDGSWHQRSHSICSMRSLSAAFSRHNWSMLRRSCRSCGWHPVQTPFVR